jgi:hypothetical protein
VPLETLNSALVLFDTLAGRAAREVDPDHLPSIDKFTRRIAAAAKTPKCADK